MPTKFMNDECVYKSSPEWTSRSVKVIKDGGVCFTVEKDQYGVSVEFETDEGSNRFTHFTYDEFRDFIERCEWVERCDVKEKK